MKRTAFILLGVIAFGMIACHPRPIEELIFADVALKSAQKAKAESLAQETYRKAENYYLRAKKDYSESYFESCKKNATQARVLAEQAEYKSLLKQNQLKGRTTEDEPPPATSTDGK